ncbi:MAG: 3',5'-cyclic-nucleotide phosphodiesterase [Sphingobacteriaceae bacterium]|nr:MAG: 3',5'-cyclic-nucleotide phosphodiesterase [Sphingobacteriaceae bacterium]
MKIKYILILPLLLLVIISSAQTKSFKIVPLGVLGGADESNLSAYMVAPSGSNNYICLDAGTINYGIQKAVANKVFTIPAGDVLQQYIKGYFISHGHLDHLGGMIVNSPGDSNKGIYGLAGTLSTLKTHYFTPQSWSNFGNEGPNALNKYTYQTLTPLKEVRIENTQMTVTAFPLSHADLTSTAFLVKSENSYVLYFGDTGSDAIEKSDKLQTVWQTIAPLIKNKQLKAIMIEVSFPNEQPDKSLFGHLTPRLLMAEMNNLSKLTGVEAIKNLNVIITHLKPPADSIAKIKAQLNAENKLGLNLIFPEQGKLMAF